MIHVLKLVAAFGWGGTERQFVNLGLGLDRTRFGATFGCLRRFGMMAAEIDAANIPVIDYGVHRLRDPRVIAAQARLVRDIRRFGIRIVHTYGFHSAVFAVVPAKLAGASVVVSIRDMGVYLSPRQKTAQRWICRLADRVLVNALAIKDSLVADGYRAEKIAVIPNGVDLTRFEHPIDTGRLHADYAIAGHAPLVAVVGRVSRKKGLEDFIAAAATIAPRFPSARFLIIGEPSFTADGSKISVDTSYQAELAALAQKLGVGGRVIFTGFRSDVTQVLPELAVSVLPSLSEGLSNTLLESMAAGAPVVATRVGGTPEVVQHGANGLLVDAGDPHALADSIARLLADPLLARTLGNAARRRIADHYSMQQLVDRTSRFYESLATPHTGSAAQLVTTNS